MSPYIYKVPIFSLLFRLHFSCFLFFVIKSNKCYSFVEFLDYVVHTFYLFIFKVQYFSFFIQFSRTRVIKYIFLRFFFFIASSRLFFCFVMFYSLVILELVFDIKNVSSSVPNTILEPSDYFKNKPHLHGELFLNC